MTKHESNPARYSLSSCLRLIGGAFAGLGLVRWLLGRWKIGNHFLNRYLSMGEISDSLHPVNRHAIGAPLRYCTRSESKMRGKSSRSTNLSVKPFVKFHSISLVEPKLMCKVFLNGTV